MLNKSVRDEQNEKIAAVLRQLLASTLVPDIGRAATIESVSRHLESLHLDFQEVLTLNIRELLPFLQKMNLDFANYELFADFLVNLSDKVEEHRTALREKAVGLYEYIQEESKIFSFEIFQKMAAIK